MKDKRNLLLLPLLLLPVVGWSVAFEALTEVPESEGGNLWALIQSIIPAYQFYFCLAAVIMVLIYIVTYTKRPHTDRECAATLLFVKGVHLIAGAGVWLSVQAVAYARKMDVSPDFNRWFVFVLCLSGCFGYFLLLCVAKNTRVRTGRVFLVCVLQFVFVLDVVSALLLWLRTKKISGEAGEEVENEPAIPGMEVAGIPNETTTPSIEIITAAPSETGAEIAPAFSPKKKGLQRFRWLLLLPAIYLPYSLVLNITIMNNVPFLTKMLMPFFEMVLVAPFIVAALCNLIYVITGLNQPDAAEKMARANMIVRLIQIPGYIINFFFTVIFMLTIFLVIVSFFLTFINILCLLVTGILGAGMVMGTVKDGKMPVRTAFFTSIFNYIYFVDAVYAIVLFIYLMVRRISKKFSKRQELI